MPQSKAAIDERHFDVLYKLLLSRVVSFGLRIPRFMAGQQVEQSGTMHVEFLMFDINILGVL